MVATRDYLKRFLLRDEFWTDESAPIGPRTCEPGPFSLSVTDSGNTFSIANNQLTVVGSDAWSDQLITASAALTDNIGMALLMRTIMSAHGISLFGAYYYKYWYPGGDGKMYVYNSSGHSIDVFAVTLNVWYDLIMISRSSGFWAVAREHPSRDYVLYWVDDISTGVNFYPYLDIYSGTYFWDSFRQTQLKDPWDGDFGIATFYNAAPTGAVRISHEADAIIHFTITTMPTADNSYLTFREDGTFANDHLIYFFADGSLVWYLRPAWTTLGSAAAGTVTAGSIIRVVMDGSSIEVWVNNSLAMSATEATYVTETLGYINAVDNIVIADFATWPRVLSGAAMEAIEEGLL